MAGGTSGDTLPEAARRVPGSGRDAVMRGTETGLSPAQAPGANTRKVLPNRDFEARLVAAASSSAPQTFLPQRYDRSAHAPAHHPGRYGGRCRELGAGQG